MHLDLEKEIQKMNDQEVSRWLSRWLPRWPSRWLSKIAMVIHASGSEDEHGENESPGAIQVAIEMAIEIAIVMAIRDGHGDGVNRCSNGWLMVS